MKKYRKIFAIILSLALILCSTMPVTALAEEANVPQEFYSITAEDPQWAALGSISARRAAVHLDESVFDDMPTEEVLRAVLEYPFTSDIFFFNTYQQGIEHTMLHCTAMRVLVQRADAYSVLRHAAARKNRADLEKNLTETRMKLVPEILNVLMSYSGFELEAIDYNIRQNAADTSVILATVYTPRGSAVSVEIRPEIPDGLRASLDEEAITRHPNATLIYSSTGKYNCHSYAWYSNSTLNSYWMKDPSKYMSDGSYTRVQKINLASKVYYTSTNHSARVYDAEGSSINNAYVISKWGNGPVMVHKVYDCPYTYPDNNELLRTTVTLWK